MSDRETCVGRTWHECGGWGNSSTCGKTAKYEEGGKWYCGTHAPSRIGARREKRDARRRREEEIRNDRRRIAAISRALKIVSFVWTSSEADPERMAAKLVDEGLVR